MTIQELYEWAKSKGVETCDVTDKATTSDIETIIKDFDDLVNRVSNESQRMTGEGTDLISRKEATEKGEWIPLKAENGDDYIEAYDIAGVHTFASRYKCDKCGFIQFRIEDHGAYGFCPNCGDQKITRSRRPNREYIKKEDIKKFLFNEGIYGYGRRIDELPTYSVPKRETTDRIEYGTDGQLYKYSISNDIPEKEKGKWECTGPDEYCCSVCHEESVDDYDFCPHCGADMRIK